MIKTANRHAAVRAVGQRKTYGDVVAAERNDLEAGPGPFERLTGDTGVLPPQPQKT